MIIIEKNCSHDSGVLLARNFYKGSDEGGSYFKSSSFIAGIQNIKRELDGFFWYLKQRGSPYKIDIMHQTKKYIKIKYPRLVGKIPNARLGYAKNIVFVESVINHYMAIWSSYSSETNAPVHGDFSLFGNFIFADDGPFIIDWEHFLLEGAPIGFDALYFLFELLCFGDSGARADRIVMAHLLKMIRLLEDNNCIAKYFNGGYLTRVLDFIEADKHIWGSQKYKLPLQLLDQSTIKFIDTQLQ